MRISISSCSRDIEKRSRLGSDFAEALFETLVLKRCWSTFSCSIRMMMTRH